MPLPLYSIFVSYFLLTPFQSLTSWNKSGRKWLFWQNGQELPRLFLVEAYSMKTQPFLFLLGYLFHALIYNNVQYIRLYCTVVFSKVKYLAIPVSIYLDLDYADPDPDL
jgi:hypothetical protein